MARKPLLMMRIRSLLKPGARGKILKSNGSAWAAKVLPITPPGP